MKTKRCTDATIRQGGSCRRFGPGGRISVWVWALAATTSWISADAPAQGQTGAPPTARAAAPSSKSAAERMAEVFPSLYWYASDACLRETTRHGFGMFEKHADFVKSTKAVLEGLPVGESRGGGQATVRLRLYDQESPQEYWRLQLTREGDTWKTKTGYKYVNGKVAFDLFQDEYLAGTRIMGSMKPYLDKALAAYSAGKDFRFVFSKAVALPAQGTSAQGGALQLVGRWRRVDTARKLATNINFRRDGSYVGSVEENGKPTWTFSGRWTLSDGMLNYEYTASSGVGVPVGTKDRDRMLALTKERYTIQNALGRQETYVRVE